MKFPYRLMDYANKIRNEHGNILACVECAIREFMRSNKRSAFISIVAHTNPHKFQVS